MFACFALLPAAQAVSPAPDGGYPGQNTAEGQNALLSLTTGGFNTANGWLSLRAVTTGSFNTGLGAGTLALNTADKNTATGAGALLSNSGGSDNTANGAFALFSNTTGYLNTATGFEALLSNTTGGNNTAIGWRALSSNTTGGDNIALGRDSGFLAHHGLGQYLYRSGRVGLLMRATPPGSVTFTTLSRLAEQFTPTRMASSGRSLPPVATKKRSSRSTSQRSPLSA